MRWFVQWAENGPVVELPFMYDAEEAACFRVALEGFIYVIEEHGCYSW